MSKIPDDLKYTPEHEWVKIEGGIAIVGITDHAQNQLGDIVFVDLPKVGQLIEKMKPIGTIESVKAASDIYCPVSCRIKEINSNLSKNPELINQDCYNQGWIAKIEITKTEQIVDLLDAKTYFELIKNS